MSDTIIEATIERLERQLDEARVDAARLRRALEHARESLRVIRDYSPTLATVTAGREYSVGTINQARHTIVDIDSALAPAPNPPQPPGIDGAEWIAAQQLASQRRIEAMAAPQAPATGLDPGTVEACAAAVRKVLIRASNEAKRVTCRVRGQFEGLRDAEAAVRALASSREGVK